LYENGELEKVSAASDCDSDQQPEIAIWPPKPEIHISGTTTDGIELPTTNAALFDHDELRKSVGIWIWQVTVITTDNRILQDYLQNKFNF